MTESPYANFPVEEWPLITGQLLEKFPLKMEELVQIVLASWEDIFKSEIGANHYKIGVDVFPQPQIMGFLLHELIPLNLAASHQNLWRRGATANEFDAHYIPDSSLSFEIKTSSSKGNIFGNRSYAKISENTVKRRGGYMLTVNFERFGSGKSPEIGLVKFGGLDIADWTGQKSETGQQASLKIQAKNYKLKTLWVNSKQG